MRWKRIAKRIFGLYDYDRRGEELIYKSIALYRKGGKFNKWRGMRLYYKIRKKYTCNIHPEIQLGHGTYIAHAHDVCIGRTAVIGDNCKFYPHCDITAAVKNDEERYANGERRHAKVGNDCIFGNGCLVVGPINIGDDVTIGAGAIVTKDVPSHTVVKNVNEFRAKTEREILQKYKGDASLL